VRYQRHKNMEIQAITRDVRISPRKVRVVADSIRDAKSIDEALAVLSLLKKRGAYSLSKTLKSAVANAINNAKLDKADLLIARIEVTEGQALKRFHPSTRGRIHPYKRRSSHVRVVLQAREGEKVAPKEATTSK
jgi:large subunit ribosomal protein L22